MRIHRVISLVITALSLAMTTAHALEMPRKLSYSVELYTAVNSSMYLYFAIFGAIFEIGAIVAVGAMAWRARHQASAHGTLAAAISVTLALVSWLILVLPVNSAIAHGASWSDLRLRWEIGHLVGFVFSLAGFVALAIATTAKNKAIDETQVRQLIASLAKAIRAKDIDGVMSMYAPNIVSFDIEPPLQYVHTKRWEQTFASYQGPIGYDVHDLRVTAAGDLAFGHSLNRVSGTLKSGRKTDFWLRWTACFRNIKGRWLITHDHVSVPVDFPSGKALLDLEP